MADDPRANSGCARSLQSRILGQLDEVASLADRAQMLWIGLIARQPGLEMNRGPDVVTSADIREKLVQPIIKPGPDMVVRIDDRKLGIERFFATARQPVRFEKLIPAQAALSAGCFHPN